MIIVFGWMNFDYSTWICSPTQIEFFYIASYQRSQSTLIWTLFYEYLIDSTKFIYFGCLRSVNFVHIENEKEKFTLITSADLFTFSKEILNKKLHLLRILHFFDEISLKNYLKFRIKNVIINSLTITKSNCYWT